MGRLAHLLDLPGQVPPGLNLQSYLSGFAFEDAYIIARISPDATAARQGMVFSHALIFPAKIISKLNDIGSVFQALRAERPAELRADSRSFPAAQILTPAVATFPGIVNALLTTSGQTTVLSAAHDLGSDRSRDLAIHVSRHATELFVQDEFLALMMSATDVSILSQHLQPCCRDGRSNSLSSSQTIPCPSFRRPLITCLETTAAGSKDSSKNST